MKTLTFHAVGEPQPKGSMKAFMVKTKEGLSRPILTSTNKGVKGWEDALRMAAQWVTDGTLIEGPVEVTVTFWLSRPASLPKKIREHVKRPDLDKLCRPFDAFNGVIWKDDSQVVSIIARKRYCEKPTDAPKAEFIIRELPLTFDGPVERPAALFT